MKSVSGSNARADTGRAKVGPSAAQAAPNQFGAFSFINNFSYAFVRAEWRQFGHFPSERSGGSCGSEVSVASDGTKAPFNTGKELSPESGDAGCWMQDAGFWMANSDSLA